MTHDVFISYSSKDKTVADAVCAKLEQQKIRCWIAPRDILPGQNFAKSIIDAIDASQVFVLIWSGNANSSKHILNEINQAFDQGLPIIPFRIQDVQPTSEMRYYFGRTHWLDALTPPLENHIVTLAATILANLHPAQEIIPDQPPMDVGLGRAAGRAGLGAEEKTEEVRRSGLPGTRTRKKWVYIPIAAGFLVLTALAWMLSQGVFKGFTLAAVTEIVPPTMTATPIPAWVNDFSMPILNAISNRKPDFQDDFSNINRNWIFRVNDEGGSGCPNSLENVVNGRLHLSFDPGCDSQAILSNMDIFNFVVQVDMIIPRSSFVNENIVIGQSDGIHLSGDGHWSSIFFESKTGIYSINPGSSETVLLISFGTRNAAYINGVPVFYFVDNEPPFASQLRLETNGQEIAYNFGDFDNLEIWDLDKIENLSSLIH
jgi:hypothetical protein